MPPKNSKPAKNNINALIADDLAANIAKAAQATIFMGPNDEEWTLTSSGSVVAGLDLFSGDDEKAAVAFTDWLVGMVVKEQQPAFRSMLRSIQGLDVPLLMKIGNAMSEEIAERPTRQSEDNSDSSPAPVSSTPSTVNSSLPDVLPSDSSTTVPL